MLSNIVDDENYLNIILFSDEFRITVVVKWRDINEVFQ